MKRSLDPNYLLSTWQRAVQRSDGVQAESPSTNLRGVKTRALNQNRTVDAYLPFIRL